MNDREQVEIELSALSAQIRGVDPLVVASVTRGIADRILALVTEREREEVERAALICDRLAEYMEHGAGEHEPGGRLRQAARMIRHGNPPPPSCVSAAPTPDEPAAQPEDAGECSSCGEGSPPNECRASKRPCGHHCNHSWSHESCCWCGLEWGEGDGDEPAHAAPVEPGERDGGTSGSAGATASAGGQSAPGVSAPAASVDARRITVGQLRHALNCMSVDAATNTPDCKLAEELFRFATSVAPSGDPLEPLAATPEPAVEGRRIEGAVVNAMVANEKCRRKLAAVDMVAVGRAVAAALTQEDRNDA